MKFTLTALNYWLHIREGNLREVHNSDGEYIGVFAPLAIELEITEGKEKGKYILNTFQAEGYGARTQAEAMTERIRAHGSVDLSKWHKLTEDSRSFEERYLENMAYAEREDRFTEGY